MDKTEINFNIVLDYIDEVIIFDPIYVEDMIDKLEYIRNYFVNNCYSRNIEILKLINSIIELYYLKSHDIFKTSYMKLRELVMNWVKYEKNISQIING